jgi:hypothetical protein
MSGVLFKIDFEKAYDKVNWAFLYQMMQLKGFGDTFYDWVMKVVKGGRVAIRVNNEIGPYFPTFAGVRQGDPLSPLLFDVVGDGLALLMKKGQEEGLVKGLVPHLIDGGISILQFYCWKMILKMLEMLNIYCAFLSKSRDLRSIFTRVKYSVWEMLKKEHKGIVRFLPVLLLSCP